LITTVLLNAKRLLVETGIKHFAIAGGVSSNSELRQQVGLLTDELDIKTYILNYEYCTDNAAMIGITSYYKFINKQFSDIGITPLARMNL
jgi:N6-L-threonylcarbamoyladenine synthase